MRTQSLHAPQVRALTTYTTVASNTQALCEFIYLLISQFVEYKVFKQPFIFYFAQLALGGRYHSVSPASEAVLE